MTSPATPENFLDMEHLTAALAFSLAARLNSIPEIMSRFDLTEDQLRRIMEFPPFQRQVREAHAKWNSEMSVGERTRLKAQMALETCLLPMQQIATSGVTPTQSRIDAMKLLASVAGMTKGDGGAPVQQGFSLRIELGDKATTLNVTPPQIEHDP